MPIAFLIPLFALLLLMDAVLIWSAAGITFASMTSFVDVNSRYQMLATDAIQGPIGFGWLSIQFPPMHPNIDLPAYLAISLASLLITSRTSISVYDDICEHFEIPSRNKYYISFSAFRIIANLLMFSCVSFIVALFLIGYWHRPLYGFGIVSAFFAVAVFVFTVIAIGLIWGMQNINNKDDPDEYISYAFFKRTIVCVVLIGIFWHNGMAITTADLGGAAKVNTPSKLTHILSDDMNVIARDKNKLNILQVKRGMYVQIIQEVDEKWALVATNDKKYFYIRKSNILAGIAPSG